MDAKSTIATIAAIVLRRSSGHLSISRSSRLIMVVPTRVVPPLFLPSIKAACTRSKVWVTFFMFITTSWITSTAVWAESPPPKISYRTYFTAQAEHSIPSDAPATEFACTDQIFTVLEVHHLPESDSYELLIVWKEPSGDIAEETRHKFATWETFTRTWAWLRLSRGTGGTLMSIVDSAAGMHRFIGEWQVEIFIDGESVGSGSFEVIC